MFIIYRPGDGVVLRAFRDAPVAVGGESPYWRTDHELVYDPNPTNSLVAEVADFRLEAGATHVFDGAAITRVARRLLLGQELAQLRAEKRAAINEERDRRESTVFPYLGRLIDCDQRSVSRITIAVQAAQVAMAAGQPFALEWTCADNSSLPLDAVGILGMPVALAVHGNSLHQHARTLKAQADAALTLDDLDASDPGSGWPA